MWSNQSDRSALVYTNSPQHIITRNCQIDTEQVQSWQKSAELSSHNSADELVNYIIKEVKKVM